MYVNAVGREQLTHVIRRVRGSHSVAPERNAQKRFLGFSMLQYGIKYVRVLSSGDINHVHRTTKFTNRIKYTAVSIFLILMSKKKIIDDFQRH